MTFSIEQWAEYAGRLSDYASGNTVGHETDLSFGTCRYCSCAYLPRYGIDAYEMFDLLLKRNVPAAIRLNSLYISGQEGRIPERIKLAAELAEYIRMTHSVW